MEFIIPLFLLFILSVVAAIAAAWAARKWIRGRSVAVAIAFFLPGLHVAYVLGISHLRDDYHRRRAETYNFDGNCVVALGYGYKLEYYDEFPEFSMLSLYGQRTANNYNDNGVSVQLLENGVQRVGLMNAGVYGAASGRNDLPGLPIDHYFFVNFVDGFDKRFKTEAELRSAVRGLGLISGTDDLFSMREGKERSSLTTWILFCSPIVIAVIAWRWANRRLVGLSNDPAFIVGASQG